MTVRIFWGRTAREDFLGVRCFTMKDMLAVAVVALALAPRVVVAAPPCAAGATCTAVTGTGNPSPAGLFVASCAGRFPDFLVRKDSLPTGYSGSVFKLGQDYPPTLPPAGTLPWATINFKRNPTEATKYLYAVRDYALDGMVAADFRPEANTVRKWYHVPLMNFGGNAREAIRGLTGERVLPVGELGLIKAAHNFAVGFYNPRGGYAIGRVWKTASAPNPKAAKFEKGTVVFKVLFTDANATNFPPGTDITAGAPAWDIAVGGQLQSLRLLQMDVAVRDSRSPTGWVYGTFAYDKSMTAPDAWHKLAAVGLIFGDDPTYTPDDQAAGRLLKETIISPDAPAYARGHLGWAGRLNGPVDNPVSSCISCHSTAEYPYQGMVTLFPSAACDTFPEKLHWFRDLTVTKAFGKIDAATCALSVPPAGVVPLGTSLQIQVGLHQQIDLHNNNPCQPTPGAAPGGPQAIAPTPPPPPSSSSPARRPPAPSAAPAGADEVLDPAPIHR
jgi:hypothetical protein